MFTPSLEAYGFEDGVNVLCVCFESEPDACIFFLFVLGQEAQTQAVVVLAIDNLLPTLCWQALSGSDAFGR